MSTNHIEDYNIYDVMKQKLGTKAKTKHGVKPPYI